MPVTSTYEERPVGHAALRPWSPCRWWRRAPASPSAIKATVIVPDACVDLVWNDGRLLAVGPDSEPRAVPVAPGERFVGVRLRPGAARLMLGRVPATALLNAQVDLAELWGGEAAALADRIGPDAGRAAGALAAALASRLRLAAPDPLVAAVAASLDLPEPPALADLARDLGFSERQLRRRVSDALGYGPKTLAQILRFRRAAGAAAAGRDLATIAAEQGFADQSHLTREVRRWSGRTPGAIADATGSRPTGS